MTYLLVANLIASSASAQAADFVLFPYSMTYNTGKHQDEYIAYLLDSKNLTISKCKATYDLIKNTLATESCDKLTTLPSKLTVSGGSDVLATIVFKREAIPQKDPVFGPDGIWRLDQSTGKVEFCVFGDVTPSCVALNPD